VPRSLSLVTAAALLASAVTVGCRAAGPPAGAESGPLELSAAETARVLATDTLFAVATNAGDVDKVAGMYAEDGLLLPPGAPPVKGRAAIREFWNGFLQPYAVTLTLGTDRVEGRGDLAYIVGHYHLVTTPKAKGTPAMPPEDGKYSEVLKRQADGSWRYVVDMYSPNSTPAAPK